MSFMCDELKCIQIFFIHHSITDNGQYLRGCLVIFVESGKIDIKRDQQEPDNDRKRAASICEVKYLEIPSQDSLILKLWSFYIYTASDYSDDDSNFYENC